MLASHESFYKPSMASDKLIVNQEMSPKHHAWNQGSSLVGLEA